MHLDEEQVQRLLHGELARPAETAVRDHVEACADCRWRVAEAQREETRVLELLRHLDDPPPRVNATAIAARARGSASGRAARRAAGILAALALAGAAYAAPGSPLPRLIDRVVARVHPTQKRSAPVASARAPEVAAGIAVTPGDRFTILFSATRANGVATVSLTDGPDVAVRATAGTARFTSDVDRLLIESLSDSARFEIEVPRHAARVEMRVGSRRIFLKDGARVSADGRQDAAGRYRIPLSRRGQ
ncbi:MAG: hypothetical protein ACJ79S_07600 [Gemmatimonadaceae bacterium]